METGDLASVDPEAWDALVAPDDPFTRHAFLAGLESSGSVGEGTGWRPRHLTAWDGARLVGAVPFYEKDHSWGEYIFDWGWARAALDAGIPYYPKLVAAVPFTPVTGRRLLVHPGADPAAVQAGLVAGMKEMARAGGIVSVNVLFCTAEEKALLDGAAGFLPRLSEQFHWVNDAGWETFDDYLAAMRSASRKQVRRERRRAASHGLTLRMWTGAEMGDVEWRALYRLYQDTVGRKGGMPYLTRAFFDHLRREMPAQVRVAFAHRGAEPVAASLFLHQGDALYGRYWGAFEPLDSMHFELCYYQAIEWCLAHGVHRFEAGAQGSHKLKRGLLPSACHSAHLLRHPGLAAAVARFLEEEAEAVAEEMDWMTPHGPFRRGPEGGGAMEAGAEEGAEEGPRTPEDEQ